MADLARIRDNQRRSRARRKEYLQELETKFRICEQTGAEASSEIQSAARAVADENKRLRLLLQSYGIVDPELPNGHQSLPAANLDRVMNVRKPCSPSESGCGAPNVQSRPLQPQPPPEPQWDQYQRIAPVTPDFLSAEQPLVQQPFMHYDSASCRDVAAVIRSLRPSVGAELEEQMGCADGKDCSMSTTRAFDLIDRLSEPHIGG